MKNCFIKWFVLLNCLPLVILCQPLPLTEVGSLPATLSETSGLETTAENSFWTINDSGWPAELYEIDSTGNLVRTITISNATNVDWEDLTSDNQGNLYLGDFGNNNHNRTNLTIYKIPNPHLVAGTDTSAEIIEFSYPDQSAFPPVDSFKNFDMEAFFWFQDSLYLFSKNWTVPFTGHTKMYRLPVTAGTYAASLIDSFFTGPGPSFQYWITGADITPDGEHVLLISHDRSWLFSCFEGADFFNGSSVEIQFPHLTQKEGVCFVSPEKLYISDEILGGVLGGKFYKADFTPYTIEPFTDLGADTTLELGEVFQLDAQSEGVSVHWNTGDTGQVLSIHQGGTYVVLLTAPNGCMASDTIVIQFDSTSTLVDRSREKLGFRIYPNPFSHQLILEMEVPKSQKLEIELRWQNGQLIQQQVVESLSAGPVHINLGYLDFPGSSQVVVLQVKWSGGEASEKLIQVR